MIAEEIAQTAAALVGGKREQTHGDKATNFENIAILWNAWLNMKFGAAGIADTLTGADVAKLMALLKIARMESGEFNPDDAIDACGYAAIAGELSEPFVAVKSFSNLPEVCKHGAIKNFCAICPEDLPGGDEVAQRGLA
jgi:hypothetical protein